MLFHLIYGKLVKSTCGGVVSLDVLTLVDHFFKKNCNRLGNFHHHSVKRSKYLWFEL